MAYFDKYGVEFSDDKKTLVQCPEDFEGEYIIPEGTTTIQEYAFVGCINLTSVIIPNSVTNIGDGAFNNCTGLTSPVYNEHIFACMPEALSGTYVIPEGIETIIGKAFYCCSGLTSIEIPNSVTSIGKSAFAGCTGLTTIEIPDAVTNIGDEAFMMCKNLSSIVLPESLQKIGFCVFKRCSNLSSVRIPRNITCIEQEAFDGCKELVDIKIPNGIKDISLCAINGCDKLRKFSIPAEAIVCHCSRCSHPYIKELITGDSIKRIGKCLISVSQELEGIFIVPEDIVAITPGAFKDCKKLTSVVLHDRIQRIGKNAFEGCTSLASINIPNSVTRIGSDAFRGCSSLRYIDVDKDNPNYCSLDGVLYDKNIATLIKYPASKQGDFIIPNNVQKIGDKAFENSIGLTFIDIPISVTNIGKSAFSGCSGLTSITVPKSVTEIGRWAWEYCTNLTSIIIETGNPTYDSRDNCNAIIETAENTLIAGCMETKIPNSVTCIDFDAFNGCVGLASIEIPNSVKEIGSRAFKGCIGLTSVIIPNNVTKIEWNTFEGCSGLTSVVIANGVKEIGNESFKDCSALTYIDIPGSVINIGYNAFRNCKKLKYLSIPDSVKDIGECAFYDCSSLEEITLPKDITKIPDWCFRGCSKLKDLVIPDSVKEIGNKSLPLCVSLTRLIIPEGVESIGDLAIYQCTKLKSITLPHSLQKIGEDILGTTLSLKEICIPKGQKARFLQMGLYKYENIIVERDNEELTITLNLAKAYEFGIGVSQNLTQAVLIYTQATEKGCAEAAYRLAEWYGIGEVLPLDLNKALDLYQQAAKSGYKDAEEKAQRIQQKIEAEEKKQADYLAEKQKEQETKAVVEAQAKPYYLFFDTETAGLPPKGMDNVPVTNPDFWPRLVQLAWILTDKEGKVLNRKSKIIYPNGFSIPASATAIHHITTEHAMQVGEPLRDVLGEFMKDLLQAEKVVGHSVKFDQHIVGAELYSMDMDYKALIDKSSICTMTSKSIIDYCALPNPNEGYNDYKWPRLPELYRILFNREFENAHDALADITATKDCFFELKRRGIIKE